MIMKVATIVWNAPKDETQVKFAKEFEESDWIVQADVLKDLVAFFQEKYQDHLINGKR